MDLFKWVLFIAVIVFVIVCKTTITTKTGFSVKVEYWQEYILIMMIIFGAMGLYMRGCINGAEMASEKIINIINEDTKE